MNNRNDRGRSATAKPDELFAAARAHHQAGRHENAGAIYRQILTAEPDHLDSLYLLATIVHQIGRLAEAEAFYRRALALSPDFVVVLNNLGNVLNDLGRPAEAEASYRRALALKPEFAEAYSNLGNTLNGLGRPDEAEACCRRALAIRPGLATAHNNLGNALKDLGRLAEAEASYRRAIEINPRFAYAHNNLANVVKDLGRLAEAEASYRHAIEIEPDFAEAHNNLGNALSDIGRSAEAERCYRRALDIKPDLAKAHHNLILAMSIMSGFDGAAVLAEAKRFDAAHGAPFRKRLAARHRNVPDPERRLRIGYLSPSLSEHVLTGVLEPTLRAHRRDRVSVHVYAHVPKPDATTWRLKEACDVWTFVHGMTDDQVAARIEQDDVDILVDPMGHWSDNRLPVFARKPAPIQVAYLCQGLTTGLLAIDYAIGDRWLNEGGAMQAFATEQVVELANGAMVYSVPARTPIGEPPSAAAGIVTFGSFNNPTKISDRTLVLWSAVLRRLPTARLLIKGRSLDQPQSRVALIERLEDHGIAAERVDLFGFVATATHLDWYNRIDVVLDTYPFCGGQTSIDALWMGVPVATRIGETMVGRYSYGYLSRIGAAELAAGDDDAYVDLAVSLADNLPRLRRYRRELRDAMLGSSLFDADLHVAELEDAYRLMWRRWCADENRS